MGREKKIFKSDNNGGEKQGKAMGRKRKGLQIKKEELLEVRKKRKGREGKRHKREGKEEKRK